MSSMPLPEGTTVLFSYADDCQVLSSGPVIKTICDELVPYLDTLADWFQQRRLEISPEKSTATLFTTTKKELKETLPVTIKGETIPTVSNPKILGVTFDQMLTYGQHAKLTREKVQNRNNVLKCLAGSTWGKSKEILKSTYEAIGRSVINYAAPVWTPVLSTTHWDDLEAAQNSALRIATGCLKMSQVTHLNQESKILPVKAHSEMLTKQHLLSMHQADHPNHHLLQEPQENRGYKETIRKFLPGIQQYTDGRPQISEIEYKAKNKKIHTDEVTHTTNCYPVNKVLEIKPPPVNQEEISLPRPTRSTLAQLRSGYSSYLNSYLHRIGATDSDKCPNCLVEAHTSRHLFSCPARPTDLSIENLWSKPIETAEFLRLKTTQDAS